jgi:hypothetical protein
MKSMTSARIVTTLGAIAGIVSAFLPWLEVDGNGYLPVRGAYGWIALAAFAIVLMYALGGNRTHALRGGGRVIAIAVGAFAAGFAAIRIFEIHQLKQLFGEDFVGPGIGLFVMCAAGLALVGAGIKPGAAPPPPIPVATVVAGSVSGSDRS